MHLLYLLGTYCALTLFILQERLRKEQNEIEKERNMTIGKVQARGGKLPTPDELQTLVTDHPAPPAQGEVALYILHHILHYILQYILHDIRRRGR